MVNLATPATYHRYTNNWKGSPMGWWATPKSMARKPFYELKGLKDFYMVGQWTATGGLHNVVMTSNHVAQIICDKFNLEFNPEPV
jgi:phytoene dehydrogenase-like protein